jgi:predicted nucleic acid-binding protein
LTTEFVLTEIANGLSAVKFREDAGNIIHVLQDDELVQIILASSELFSKGLDLYENRKDKDWGLTDCISFVVMQEMYVTAALTPDDHFRQAGFRALLLEDFESYKSLK